MQPDVLVFDPMYYMHDKDENSNHQMTSVIRRLDALQDSAESNPALIVVTHMGNPHLDQKGNTLKRGRADVRGASVIVGWPDSVIEVREGGIGAMELTFTLRNIDIQYPRLKLRWTKSGGPLLPATKSARELSPEEVVRIVRTVDGKSKMELAKLIAKACGGSDGSALRVINGLIDGGVLREHPSEQDKRIKVISL